MLRLNQFLLLALGLFVLAPVTRAQSAADPVVVETKQFTLRESDYRKGVLRLLGDTETGRHTASSPNSFYLREILRDRVLQLHGRKLGLHRAPEVLALPADKQEWDIRRRAAEDLKLSIQITDEQLRAAYEELKPELETARVRQLLVGFKGARFDKKGFTRDQARVIAEETRKEITDGAGDLEEFAREASHHEASARTGGLIRFRRGEVEPVLEDAAFSTPIGELRVVESKMGFHVMRVEKRWFEPSFEESRAELEETERAVQFEKLLDATIKSWRPKYAAAYAPSEDW